MKKIIILMLYLSFTSCDPMNGNMKVKNMSDKHIYFRMLFKNEIETGNYGGTRPGIRENKPFEYKEFVFFNSWDAEFHSQKDSLVKVIVMENKFMLYDTILRELKYDKWDSIYKFGDYFFKEYSLKEIKEKKFVFTYPDDGFKKNLQINN